MDSVKLVEKKIYHISVDRQPILKEKSFLGVEYDTLTIIVGFIVPLISFFLGFLFSIFRDKFKERTEINIVASSFMMWTERTIKSASTLLKEIDDRKNETNDLDNFQVSKPANINLHLNRLSSDQGLLYKAFVKQKKGDLKTNFDDYSKIIVDVDFLGDFQKMLSQNSQYIVDDFQSLFDKWNDSVRSVHKAKHILIGRRANNGDEKIEIINGYFNEWYKTNNQGLLSTYNFLNQLDPILQEFYNNNPGDDDLAELLSAIQQTKFIYNQFVFKKSEVVKIFKGLYDQLDETIIEIDTLSKKINNKENRLFII